MKSIEIKVKSTILSIVVCLLAAVAICLVLSYSGRASAETRLEGEDDVFELTDREFAADEGFVFSATANFSGGAAAGLVFGADEDSYWVFNTDRASNAVKLMYFDYSSGEKNVRVIKSEYYVGSALMNEGEQNYVRSRTANIDKVYLAVKIKPAADKTYAEFYADGIRRFAYVNGSEAAVDLDISSVTVGEGDDAAELNYTGGKIGYNCFNASVSFTDEIVESGDGAYYSEQFRNQYHFSQYAHWNNDPNGLVYYNGYYHLYYQHNPYGNTWDAMHWGHSRSKDLVHWEHLPIALVPDYDLPVGENKLLGAMWSGSARVYHKGDSDRIDNEKWFGDASDKNVGDALGLIGWYSWYGDGGNLYQVTMYSTDGGLSWHKSVNIPCGVSKDLGGSPVSGGSWRDPKVFDISEISGISDGYRWGMALTDMEDNILFFLKSKNMVDWEHAGCYEVYRPECPDVVSLSDGANERTVITFTSRYYVVCDLAYESGDIVMKDGGVKITSLMQGDPRLKKMDHGVDSYAAQTFYIDDDSDSAYRGKAVSVSWFSGVPNAPESIESGVLQTARKVWNGGGMTIPVVYGLIGDTLTTTPITVCDPTFEELKKGAVDIYYSPLTDSDPLASVRSNTAEIIAEISNPSRTGVSIKVNMSADGARYTEIGWNRTEGYFVDRTHTDDAGINFPLPNYAKRYSSGMGKDNTVLDFYILVDKNNVEAYCDGFTVPFYILTFAAPQSNRMSLTAENEIMLRDLRVNEIGTVWREDPHDDALFVSDTDIELGLGLSSTKKISASGGELDWEITEGAGVIELTPTATGATVKALSSGTAVIRVSCGDRERNINVTVHDGVFDTNLTFTDDGIIDGEWMVTDDGLVGSQVGGDGYILADEECADFIYSANFDIGSGRAAALIFRASEKDGRLTNYIIANYDNDDGGKKVVKLWSRNRSLGRAEYTPADIHNVTLTAAVNGDTVKISIDGTEVINVTLDSDEPKIGHLGLNVFPTRATFFSAKYMTPDCEYTEGQLEINDIINTRIDSVINKTLKNTEVSKQFYTFADGVLSISEDYVSLLPKVGKYELRIIGNKAMSDIVVTVKSIPESYVQSAYINEGSDARVFIGKRTTDYLKINGTAIASRLYRIENYILIIDGSALQAGENIATLSDGTVFTVSVTAAGKEHISIQMPPVELNMIPFIIAMSTVCGLIVLAVIAFIVVMSLRNKGKVELEPFADRTEAIRRRNLGLIAGACIAGSIALVLLTCMLTSPLGTAGFAVAFAITVIFGYPYAAQMFWRGKLYRQTLSAVRTMGTPKEIFDIDGSGNKFKVVLRYIGAAFKTLWLCIRILLSGTVALIRAPFLFAGQLHGITYGEFGFSNKPDSVAKTENAATDSEAAGEV